LNSWQRSKAVAAALPLVERTGAAAAAAAAQTATLAKTAAVTAAAAAAAGAAAAQLDTEAGPQDGCADWLMAVPTAQIGSS